MSTEADDRAFIERLRRGHGSPLELLCRQGPDAVRNWLEEIEDAHGPQSRWATVCNWRLWARPEQLAPRGRWLVWVIQAGRGWGKNRTGSEWVHEKAERMPGSRGALVARTSADARDTVVRGVSGILATAKPWNPVVYTPTNRELRWANGTVATTYSSEEPDLLRGPNHHWGIADEFATWKATKAADGGTAWDHLRLGCRLELNGEPPQIVVQTTPRPTAAMKALLAERGVVVTRGHQHENAANLSADYIANMMLKYGGTRMGRQEIAGEMLSDIEGAIVTLDMIDALRFDELPPDASLQRIGVGVDPSGGANEQGIVGAALIPNCPCTGMGAGPKPHYAVLGDSSGRYSPEGWGRRSVGLYYALSGDRIFGEKNFGGDMVQATIRNIDPDVPYEDVQASRGKVVRAEPVLALYEQKRVHHVGTYKELEDEVCAFTAEEYKGIGSPNRADALVWVLTKLSGRKARMFRAW